MRKLFLFKNWARLSESGITLVEVMVSIALGGILITVSGQLLAMAIQSAYAAQGILEMTNLVNELQRNFIVEGNCRVAITNKDSTVQTFGNIPLLTNAIHPYTVPLNIYKVVGPAAAPGGIMLNAALPSRFGKLNVTGVNFQSIDHIDGSHPKEKVFYGTINIAAQRSGLGPIASAIRGSLPVAIVTTVNGAIYTIKTCQGISPDSAAPQVLPACSPGQILWYSRTNRRWECKAAR